MLIFFTAILFSFANKHEIIIVCRSLGHVLRDTILKDARQQETASFFARRLFALQIQIGTYANKITHGPDICMGTFYHKVFYDSYYI